MKKLRYQGSSGYAIFEDWIQGAYPFVVGHDGLVTKQERFDRLTKPQGDDQEIFDSMNILGRFPTYWRALIDVLERDGYSREDALNEAGRRELSSELHQRLRQSENQRLAPLVKRIEWAMPKDEDGSPRYNVVVDHLGGGIFAVGIYNGFNDAYVLITDLDSYPMVGFYRDAEDEEGLMVEPLGHMDAPLDSEKAQNAVIDTLRILDQFFKRPRKL